MKEKLFEYDGKACDLQCEFCDSCIFTENVNERKDMVKQNDITKITCCNECVCATCKEADCSRGQLNNWYCSSKGIKRIIDMSVLSTATITIPTWCPMGLYKKPKANEEKKGTKKVLTWMEKRDLWEKITPLCEWDKIKVNEVYHVPPVLDEKRKDIMIINKTDFSFQYRNLSTNIKDSNACIYTVYKTIYWWKFMVKHKLKKVEVVNTTTNK